MTNNIVENLQYAPDCCPLITVTSGTYDGLKQMKQMNEKQFIEHPNNLSKTDSKKQVRETPDNKYRRGLQSTESTSSEKAS